MEETITTTTKRQRLHPPQVTHIPLDLVTEILCRLPVKFLMQFRCVCKSWNNLISNDLKFAKKHLSLSTKRKHLIKTTWSPVGKLNVMSYPLNSLQLDSIFTTFPRQLEYSSISPKYSNNFIASCDGLLCFAIDHRRAFLLNPCIKKLKELPSLEIPQENGYTRYAFGYDPFIHNYKVVSVFSYDLGYDGIHANGCKTQVNVHTLGTHSWRRIKDFPSLFPHNEPGIIVNGAANWFAYSMSGNFSSVIVSLDLEKECYQEIPQPNYGIEDNLTLGTMRDCLCVFSRSYSFNDVWLMKEYKNKESWIKLIRLPRFSNPLLFHDNATIIYISEDDNHVLLSVNGFPNTKWLVFDIHLNNTINSLQIPIELRVNSKVYVESLISP